jgi:hypothetical protein
MGPFRIGSYESAQVETSHSRLVYCMMITLLPSTIVSAWELSSIRPKVAAELSLLMRVARFIDKVRRLEVLFAATTVCIISLKVTFVDCRVTFDISLLP